MKKVLTILIILALVLILLIGYFFLKTPQEPPEISVLIGDRKIDYVVAKNKWNNAVYDREDTFKSIMKDMTIEDIPYIEIGNTAAISFKNNPPREFKIYDILIDKAGSQIYPTVKKNSIKVKKEWGKYTFEINKNIESALSSTYIENKKDIRGFRMIASWGKNECEYAFVIKTDAY